jgi:hypothetical protein
MEVGHLPIGTAKVNPKSYMSDPAFRVPVTLTSIPFDVLGAYTLVKMADNLGKIDLFRLKQAMRHTVFSHHNRSSPVGHPICPARPALVAGAVFGTVFAVGLTILGCCVIGRSRTIYAPGFPTSGSARSSCCGNRVRVYFNTTEYYSGFGTSGVSNSHTTGTVYNSAHGIGIYWDPGVVTGGLLIHTHSSHDTTTTRTSGYSTTIMMR